MSLDFASQSRTVRGALVLVVWLPIFGRVATPVFAEVEELRGQVSIELSGKSALHEFSGRGAAMPFQLVGERGRWRADVEVPVRSLDTGNSWRDEKMHALLRGEEFPVVRAHFLDLDPLAVRDEGRMAFALTIGAVTRPITALVRDWRQSEDEAGFTASFDVSLAAFGLEAPGALFLKVDDTVHVVVAATVKRP